VLYSGTRVLAAAGEGCFSGRAYLQYIFSTGVVGLVIRSALKYVYTRWWAKPGYILLLYMCMRRQFLKGVEREVDRSLRVIPCLVTDLGSLASNLSSSNIAAVKTIKACAKFNSSIPTSQGRTPQGTAMIFIAISCMNQLCSHLIVIF
jgi:hypothetical protein